MSQDKKWKYSWMGYDFTKEIRELEMKYTYFKMYDRLGSVSPAVPFVLKLVRPLVMTGITDTRNFERLEYRDEEGYFSLSYFIPAPRTWVWREIDRQLCVELYQNQKAFFSALQAGVKMLNTLYELAKRDDFKIQDYICFLPESLVQERAKQFFSVVPGYFLSIYPQKSLEREAEERFYENQRKFRAMRKAIKKSKALRTPENVLEFFPDLWLLGKI